MTTTAAEHEVEISCRGTLCGCCVDWIKFTLRVFARFGLFLGQEACMNILRALLFVLIILYIVYLALLLPVNQYMEAKTWMQQHLP